MHRDRYIGSQVGAVMAKVVVRKLGGSKADKHAVAVVQKRVRDASSGQFLTFHTIDAQSKTFGQDLNYVFAKNVDKARRENKAVAGVRDRVPPKA